MPNYTVKIYVDSENIFGSSLFYMCALYRSNEEMEVCSSNSVINKLDILNSIFLHPADFFWPLASDF